MNPPPQPQQSYFWQYLTAAAIMSVLIAYLTGNTPATGDFAAVTGWLWSLARWAIGIAGLLSAAMVVRLVPVAWLKYRAQVARVATDEALIRNELLESNVKIDAMRADVVAKLSSIQQAVQRNQAEIRQLSVHVESLTANKSAVLIDTSQANWQSTATLLRHPEKPTATATEAEPQKELRLIEDVLLKEPRFLLIGGTGSGKSNTTKHYLSALAERGAKVTIIDPHSPSKLLGIDCIGAGLNFEQIAHFMIQTMLTVTKAYQTGNVRQDGDFGADNHFLVVDEYADIVDNVGEDLATQFLRCLLIRGRKAGFRFCLISQSDSVSSLGIKGDSKLLDGAQKVELKYDRLHDTRRAIIGWRKADQYEVTVPGVFEAYPQIPTEQVIIDPPKRYNPSETKIAKALISLNGDASNTPKVEILRRADVGINARNKRLLNQLLQVT